MGDYSYVTLSVEASHKGNFEAILDGLGHSNGLDQFEEGGSAVFEVSEARYGFPDGDNFQYGDQEVAEIVKALIESSIPWRAYDGGGYEWPETEYAWSPELGKVKKRYLGDTGGPVLTVHQFRMAREVLENGMITPDELIKGIEDHFGDDPKGWL